MNKKNDFRVGETTIAKNETIVTEKTNLSFERETKLPLDAKKQKIQVSIMLDKDSKKILKHYSKTVGKNASEVINELIKLNCSDFNEIGGHIFGTYGYDVSFYKNLDLNVLSRMSKEEFVAKYVNIVLEKMKVSIYHCIAPKRINQDYDIARELYFSPNMYFCGDIEKYISMLLLLFVCESFEDIVVAMYGEDSDEHYIVKIYNKYLDKAEDDAAECWKHMYDYGVFIDDYTKKLPNGEYYTRIGTLLNVCCWQNKAIYFVNDAEM